MNVRGVISGEPEETRPTSQTTHDDPAAESSGPTLSPPQSPLKAPPNSSTRFAGTPYKLGGLLSDQPSIRSKEAANHILNAIGEGRAELVTGAVLEQLLPDGACTSLSNDSLGFYSFGGHRFSKFRADSALLVLFQAAVFAAPAPVVPLVVGLPTLVQLALDPAVRRDADERFMSSYGFPRSELLATHAGACSFTLLEAGDTLLEMILKVGWPGRWLQGQKDRATASLLRQILTESHSHPQFKIFWMCKAIARTRKALAPTTSVNGSNRQRSWPSDRQRIAVAIMVLEEDLLPMCSPSEALYNDGVARKFACASWRRTDARLPAAKMSVIELLGSVPTLPNPKNF